MATHLICIDTLRACDRGRWIEALTALGRDVALAVDPPRPIAAIAPVADWASRRGDVVALRRVADEIVLQSEDWPDLRPLALRARAILAAEPGAR